MASKRNLLFATLLFGLAACSSHMQSGGVVPQTMGQSRSSTINPATSCVIVPNSVGTGFGSFGNGVGGVSATDAWAVGASNLTFRHFDGTAWRVVPAPTIPNRSSYRFIFINDVTPVASNDVWVDGQGAGPTSLTAFFLHWNGTAWKYVPSAPTLTNEYGIAALAGNASNNVWAIAVTAAVAPAPSIQLERWNGSTWSFVASQSDVSGFGDVGDGLVVLGPSDVWMMLGATFSAIIDHWNGSTLTTTGLPYLNGNLPSGGFFAGTAADDLWFTSNLNVNPSGLVYVAHRSSSWGLYNTSLITGYTLDGVIDVRPGYVLMPASDPSGKPALLVYNGFVRWRPTNSPWPAGAFGLGTGHLVKGTTSFWASFSIGNTSEVALVKCPSTPPAPL